MVSFIVCRGKSPAGGISPKIEGPAPIFAENGTDYFAVDAGYFYDAETGLYYLPARYYSPTLRRFLTKDPDAGKKTNPLTLNPYQYCENDPVNRVDPSGQSDEFLPICCSNCNLDPIKIEIEPLDMSWADKLDATLSGLGDMCRAIDKFCVEFRAICRSIGNPAAGISRAFGPGSPFRAANACFSGIAKSMDNFFVKRPAALMVVGDIKWTGQMIEQKIGSARQAVREANSFAHKVSRFWNKCGDYILDAGALIGDCICPALSIACGIGSIIEDSWHYFVRHDMPFSEYLTKTITNGIGLLPGIGNGADVATTFLDVVCDID